MPVKRKVIIIGDSRGITIPKSWLELVEKQIGQRLEHVAMEIDSSLTIVPMVEGQVLKVIFTEENKKLVEKEEEVE